MQNRKQKEVILMIELTKHVEQHMIHADEFHKWSDDRIKETFSPASYYSLDTESCDDNVTAWVYGWSIGNTGNDYQIYCENIDDIYAIFEKIARVHNVKYNSKKGNETFKIFVHNLVWDFEFLKYSLFRMGYQMYFGEVKYGMKFGALKNGTFSMISNENEIYGATIRLHNSIKHTSTRKNKKGEYNEQEVAIELELIDSYKIMSKKLEEIARDVLVLEEKFQKLNDDYDYKSIRQKGHKLTKKEKNYLYNDVYILKEFIKQFYIPLDTKKTTASAADHRIALPAA